MCRTVIAIQVKNVAVVVNVMHMLAALSAAIRQKQNR